MKSRDKVWDSKYDAYVEHPRYGKRPRFTGLNPEPYGPGVHLNSNATSIHELQDFAQRTLGHRFSYLKPLEKLKLPTSVRVPGTAILADAARQSTATIPVTHYYDIEKVCRNCQRPFIFFAEEQKHWYEKLQFGLDSDCVRCTECRKKEQALARARATYERLVKIKNRTSSDNVKMATCAITLIENGIFGIKVIPSLRALLKAVPDAERDEAGYQDLTARLRVLNKK